ncbi:MAG: glucose 1-dehydrogenase [Chloroflexi bacterium]|nr:glucose 1-dehydrogenase [Chloroflexota bacterium]
MRLEGKVAIISGGARGMGATEARMFAKEGAKVVFGDVRDDLGKQVEAEISEASGAAIYVSLDVTDELSWQNAVDMAVSRFGKLDILVNNAGIVYNQSGDDATVEEWDRLMDVNAKGVFLGIKAVIPEMRKAGGGSIINISSISGMIGQHRIHPGYNASKGAVRLLTKATAIQYANDGIRVNSVHPGPIATPMNEASRADPEHYQNSIDSTPMGRYGQPEDIAYGVLFLASDESSYMTGSELVIDGGYTAQ